MNLLSEFQPIRDWADARGLIKGGDPKTQTLKLIEEVGELARAIIKENDEEARDAIGDCVVVLTNLAAQKGWRIESCVNDAYDVIQNRKGIMKNGSFQKEA